MIELNPCWKFSDVQDNVEAIKTRYELILSSFLCYQIKERGEALHTIKREVFDYPNIQYWQRERLWEVLNGDFEIEKFRGLCK